MAARRRLARVAVASAFGCLALWLASWPGVLADEQPARTIKTIEFVGLKRTGERLVRELVGLKPGTPLDTAELDHAVTRLLRTGRFLSARYNLQNDDDGVRVLFELHERPFVTAVRFEGNARLRDGRLKGLVSQNVGSPVDWLAVRDGRDAIVAAYHEAGYGNVDVTYDQKRLQDTGELVYLIREGRRVRIRRIVFEGNQAFEDRTLQRQIETKKAFWIFRAGVFDEGRADADVARLQRFYRDRGFLDARVTYHRQPSADGRDLTVTFTIEEGTRYTIEAIDFRGHTVFTREELFGLIVSRVGRTVRPPQVEADAQAIHTRYGELGYIYSTVRAIRVFSDTPGFVRITFEIHEGEQYRVGRVVVRGNTRTRDKVVRRALNLYPPDDLFDLTEAREAQRRLLQTRIFGSARVYPVGTAPGTRDVVIDVREAEKVGDFLFGAGVTSNSGLVGNIVLDLQNFDASDWPRSWSELFKFRSFFGGGQRLRVELQPGTEVSRFRLDFTEPYLLDRPVRLDVGGFLFERGRDGYDEGRAGVTVSFGKRFERGRLRGWTGELAFRGENLTVRDVDLFAARDIRDDEGSGVLTSVKTTLVRDRTDNRFVPTTGDRVRLAYEQVGILGGDFAFGKLTAGYTRYKTLATDLRDRKHVLKLRAEGGAILGDAPVPERFFAGGTGSIRGFDFRGVGPRDGIDDNNIGGDYLLLGASEYSFPFIGQKVRGLVFVDAGLVGTGGLRASVGAGIRFTLNVFGPVPIELDFAIPVASQSGDEKQVFSFLVGRIF